MKVAAGSCLFILLALTYFNLAQSESQKNDGELFTALSSQNATEALRLIHPSGAAVYPKHTAPDTGDWALYFSSPLTTEEEDVISSPYPICDAGMATSEIVIWQNYAVGAFVCRYTPIGAFEPDNNDFIVVAWNRERAVILGHVKGDAIPHLLVESDGKGVLMEWLFHSDYQYSYDSHERTKPIFRPRRARISMPSSSRDLRMQVIEQ